MEPDVECRGGREDDRHLVPETNVRGALPDIHGDIGGPLSAVATVDVEDRVLEPESGELRRHRRLVVQSEVCPAVGDIAGLDGDGGIRCASAAPGSDRHAAGVRARHTNRRGRTREVSQADQEQSRAAFDERRSCVSLRHADAALGIDRHVEQHVRIERGLDSGDGALLIGFTNRVVQPGVIRRRQWLAEIREGRFHPPHVLRQRLQSHRCDDRVRRLFLLVPGRCGDGNEEHGRHHSTSAEPFDQMHRANIGSSNEPVQEVQLNP